MPQTRSGWLTILPSGRWYLQDSRLYNLNGRSKRISTNLGPFAVKKQMYFGLPALQPGRIRTKVRWKWANDGVSIGPLIGILTVGEGSVFYGNRENFKDIFLTGKKLGALVFVFTPSQVNWAKKSIRGFVYDEKQGVWTVAEFPFPHVVYNRVPTRKQETRSDVSDTLTRIAAMPNVTLFNLHFFNKQTLFHTLEKMDHTSHFLPETKKLDSVARLKSFGARHQTMYLKPVQGKAGEGIMRLQFKDNYWQLQRVHAQKSITRLFPSLDAVWKYLQPQIKKKKYIIQQGITLAKYKGRPFDVRVLVQKNGKGEWGVTGVGIRRAGARSITTHVPRGGSIQSPERVFNVLFGDMAESIMNKIEETALTVARSLNQEIRCLAEMSMDLGLTSEGRLWFFEANAKPEKFDEPAIRRSSLNNLIQYAQYVSRLQIKQDAQAG